MRPLHVLGWILVGGVAGLGQIETVATAGETAKVASVEGVTEYRLGNGARVLS